MQPIEAKLTLSEGGGAALELRVGGRTVTVTVSGERIVVEGDAELILKAILAALDVILCCLEAAAVAGCGGCEERLAQEEGHAANGEHSSTTIHEHGDGSAGGADGHN